MSYKWIFKYIMVGDTGCGKTSLLFQFTDKRFQKETEATIGVEFGSRVINVYDNPVKLQIWDTSGDSRFKSITRSYYRGSTGVFLVYDITRRETFQHVKTWLKEVQENTGYVSRDSQNIMLVGNKCDLEHRREITRQEAQEFADQHGLLYMEASAKSGDNVDSIFLTLSSEIYDKITKGTVNPRDKQYGIKSRETLDISLIGEEKTSCCKIN